jgi:hypothetical protein
MYPAAATAAAAAALPTGAAEPELATAARRWVADRRAEPELATATIGMRG